ncbi:aldose 1-epimerase family protein [[Clostridium] cellulosi]
MNTLRERQRNANKNMTFEIMSDGAVAQIDSKGAELISLKDIFGTEYIWQGDEKYWNRHSPILFPIIGEQKNGQYEYNGKIYSISRHGFARDMEFKVINHTRDRIILALSFDENTLKKYPFNFRLQVTFSLESAVLHVEYLVQNIGDSEMFFCIGGHTGYNVPLMPDEKFEDYYVKFEKHENFNRMLLNENGLYSGKTRHFLDGDSFQLNHSIFDDDAVVPDKLNSKSVSLVSRKTGRGVTVEFPDFDNLAIWSPKGDAPFVCLEPWNGQASDESDDINLCSKKGIIELKAGGFYSACHTITLL